eukprot:GILJ01003519.1.p1 GENE.GILJ01003519.1~~GILJ01003519.1.p1  ORF type:complete len:1186 (-),score=204.90 GILJ01003519.1:249-3806(-)
MKEQKEPFIAKSIHGQGIWPGLRLAVNYVIADTKKRVRSFRIGVLTVFLVVLFVSLLQSAVQLSPIMFLRLAEQTVSETDLMLTPVPAKNDTTLESVRGEPSNSTGIRLLNATFIGQRLQGNPYVAGTTPRWALISAASNPDFLPGYNLSVYTLILDTKKELDIGLGRSWPYRPLGRGECYMSGSALRALHLEPDRGNQVQLHIDLYQALKQAQPGTGMGEQIDANTVDVLLTAAGITVPDQVTFDLSDPATRQAFGLPAGNQVNTSFGVIDTTTAGTLQANRSQILESLVPLFKSAMIFDKQYAIAFGANSAGGKWPTTLGNVVAIDSNYIIETVQQQFRKAASSNGVATGPYAVLFNSFVDSLGNMSVNDYALSVAVVANNREQLYTDAGSSLQDGLVRMSDSISKSIGIQYPVSVTAPIASQLATTETIRLFLDNVFRAVVIVLCLLSVLLVYSLMLTDVEEKTYEFGMLRALGMKQYTLIELLMSQAIHFAVPGVVLGLIVAWIINIFVAFIIAEYADMAVSFKLADSAIILGVCLGIFMPLVSNIVPIRRALSNTLRDALDVYHHVVNDTVVKMIKLANLGISPIQTSFAVLMVVVGFITYYLMPLAFTFNNIALFLALMNIILLGMLLGLVLVGQIVEPYLERITLRFILWVFYHDRNLYGIVSKQLVGHRSRNKKTALMFTLALSFLIFGAAMFSLEGTNLAQNIQLTLGSDLVATTPYSKPLAVDGITNFLRSIGQDSSAFNQTRLVDDFTFVTFPLSANDQVIDSISFSNYGGFPSLTANVYGTSANYLNVAYNEYYLPKQLQPGFQYPLIQAGARQGDSDAVRALYITEDQNVQPKSDFNSVQSGAYLTAFQYAQLEGYFGRAASNMASFGPRGYKQTGFNKFMSSSKPINTIVSDGLRNVLSVSCTHLGRLTMALKNSAKTLGYYGNIRGMMQKVPGFSFSSYQITSMAKDILVSQDQYALMLHDARVAAASFDTTVNVTQVPNEPVRMQKLLIRVMPGLTKADRETVANGVRNYFPDSDTTLVDTVTVIEDASTVIQLMQVFFVIVAAIAIILAFFLLLISFSANVRENAWEYGVLRAVGLTGNQVTRVYVYEAVSLTVASIVLGTVIGILVAVTLILQMGVFTELPFQFDFPVALFITMIALAITTAIAGSYYPASYIKSKPISNVLKGLSQ